MDNTTRQNKNTSNERDLTFNPIQFQINSEGLSKNEVIKVASELKTLYQNWGQQVEDISDQLNNDEQFTGNNTATDPSLVALVKNGCLIIAEAGEENNLLDILTDSNCSYSLTTFGDGLLPAIYSCLSKNVNNTVVTGYIVKVINERLKEQSGVICYAIGIIATGVAIRVASPGIAIMIKATKKTEN